LKFLAIDTGISSQKLSKKIQLLNTLYLYSAEDKKKRFDLQDLYYLTNLNTVGLPRSNKTNNEVEQVAEVLKNRKIKLKWLK